MAFILMLTDFFGEGGVQRHRRSQGCGVASKLQNRLTLKDNLVYHIYEV